MKAWRQHQMGKPYPYRASTCELTPADWRYSARSAAPKITARHGLLRFEMELKRGGIYATEARDCIPSSAEPGKDFRDRHHVLLLSKNSSRYTNLSSALR